MDQARKNEILAVILFAASLFLFLSILTFNDQDISFYTSAPNIASQNATGLIGSYTGGVLLFFIGKAAYVIPLLVMIWGVSRLLQAESRRFSFKLIGTIVLVAATSAGLSMMAESGSTLAFDYGGVTGTVISGFLLEYLGSGGAVVFVSALMILSLLIATEFLILPVMAAAFRFLWENIKKFAEWVSEKASIFIEEMQERREEIKRAKEETAKKLASMKSRGEISHNVSHDEAIGKKPKAEIAGGKLQIVMPGGSQKAPKGSSRAAQVTRDANGRAIKYKLPNLDLLKTPSKSMVKNREESLKRNAAILEKTLSEFDVDAKVVKINKGPVITMYELEPSVGTKVNKITSLGDNISLAMKSAGIRIVAPLPGKGTIGIEVPNEESELVLLRDILESVEYHEEDSQIKLALGKDVSGVPMIADLGKMPHLLIAGATGSGKTVCLNAIISSLLYSSTPDELKFIMVDPKRVELMMFEGIPHLISPIVTKPKKAALALNWVVGEMERRYEIFAEKSVRNISAYKESQTEEEENLPFIIVVVDELADLMMVAQQDVEGLIMRIAQLSRAAGIHMILATQRPSVNVITGVIKANFPARISFKVASKVDSRTVLDVNGAEKLLGRGDMLFMQPGEMTEIRGQCSLVEDSEIRKVVKFIKSQADPEYIEEVAKKMEKGGTATAQEKDELYEEAFRVISETKQASVSMIQRKLRVGYTRAARIIDQMEEDGVVGAYNGAKPREILIENLEELEEAEE
ncbi:MAG: DNA translocase FtsK [Candidatus Omnitrophica bacterium]|nr:DNA translocase FtsK [Candidatus Omnitrophota bacterium]